MGPSSSSGRYGGFGSESAGRSSFGGTTRGVYGDGGGFGGETSEDYDEGGRRGGADRFDEYDEYDDGGAQAPAGRRKADAAKRTSTAAKKAPAPAPKPKEPEVDLFDFGDDEPATTVPSNGAATSSAAILAPPPAQPSTAIDDDDFDDFQSATPAPAPAPIAAPPSQSIPSIPRPNYNSFPTTTSTTQYAQPTPQSGAQQAGFNTLFSTTSPPPPTGTASPALSGFAPPQQKPAPYQPSGPNYYQSVPIASHATGGSIGSGISSSAASIGGAKKPAAKSGGGDAFASLLSGSGLKKTTPVQKGPTIADMAKQKTQAGLYGADAPKPAQYQPPQQPQKPAAGSAMNDLLG
jgi:epsin